MIRLLIFMLFCFLAYTLYTAVMRSLSGGRKAPPPEKSGQGENMVHDPQCGTYLPMGDAVEKTVQGEKHYFCSTRCRDAFVKARK